MAETEYMKLKNKLNKIDDLMKGYDFTMNRYMRNGIEGHEWEYIDMTKGIIEEIKAILR